MNNNQSIIIIIITSSRFAAIRFKDRYVFLSIFAPWKQTILIVLKYFFLIEKLDRNVTFFKVAFLNVVFDKWFLQT